MHKDFFKCTNMIKLSKIDSIFRLSIRIFITFHEKNAKNDLFTFFISLSINHHILCFLFRSSLVEKFIDSTAISTAISTKTTTERKRRFNITANTVNKQIKTIEKKMTKKETKKETKQKTKKETKKKRKRKGFMRSTKASVD